MKINNIEFLSQSQKNKAITDTGLPSGFDIMYLALGDRNKRTLLIAFEALNKKVQEIWN